MKKLYFLFFLTILLIGQIKAQNLRVITYNIRYATASDGVNEWKLRKAKVADLLNKQRPDIICIQEALHSQMLDLQKSLSAYFYVGVGRDDGKQKGEFSAIFFLKANFELENSGTFWLSSTPDSIGSIGWDAVLPRICTYAKVKMHANQKSIYVFNTHLDHKGEIAKTESANLILRKINELAKGFPVLLAGDFNSEPNSQAYQSIIQNPDPILADYFKAIESQENCTFKGFETKSTVCKRIDYIFGDSNFRLEKFEIFTDNNGTYYPSDHLPVCVDLILP
jgi:endonuclease/exonuclease/phosphatase family metal-dependent hydrolase